MTAPRPHRNRWWRARWVTAAPVVGLAGLCGRRGSDCGDRFGFVASGFNCEHEVSSFGGRHRLRCGGLRCGYLCRSDGREEEWGGCRWSRASRYGRVRSEAKHSNGSHCHGTGGESRSQSMGPVSRARDARNGSSNLRCVHHRIARRQDDQSREPRPRSADVRVQALDGSSEAPADGAHRNSHRAGDLAVGSAFEISKGD